MQTYTDQELIRNLHRSGSIMEKSSARDKEVYLINTYTWELRRNAYSRTLSYCPLVWMCHNGANNNRINRLRERCLQIVYNDKQSSFNEFNGSVLIHMRNIQILPTEMYKLINNLWPPITNRVFKLNSDSCYNLRQISQFSRSSVRSVFHEAESISSLGPKIWDILPDDYKSIQNLDTFKIKIKKWNSENCPCRLYKVYIDRVGFL